jgi:membrane protein YdbS with pleckstrin-like domain
MSLVNEPAAENPAITATVAVQEPAALNGLPPTLPVSEAELNSQDPQALTLSWLVNLIFACVVNVALFVGVLVWALLRGQVDLTLALVSGTALLLIVGLQWLSAVWPRWDYEHSKWRLDARGFEIRKGVFWRHQITVPAARVQHVDVSQGPLQRRYGLATLTIHTAGTQNESVAFEGLSHAVAIALKDRLIVEKEAVDVL